MSAVDRIMAVGLLMAGSLISVGTAAEPAPASPLKPALRVGEEVPSFYCRAVTGPLMNKSVCYVCRNGQRPVVMLLMRQLRPEYGQLLQGIDRVVDENRAGGLRGFGVLVSDGGRQATAAVQTFAFNHKLSLPLTVSSRTIVPANSRLLPPAATLSVVLYRHRKVVAAFSYRAGELQKTERVRLLRRIRQFINDETMPLR